MEGQTFICGNIPEEILEKVFLISILQAMFDILEADIVIFQETKIQRKDLSDDMVLVPGWDCYFSLPRHKKGNIRSHCPLHVIDRSLQATLASSFTPGNQFVHRFAPKKVLREYCAPPIHRRASPSCQKNSKLVVIPQRPNWQLQ